MRAATSISSKAPAASPSRRSIESRTSLVGGIACGELNAPQRSLRRPMHQPVSRPPAPRIPALIKRNTILFALSQSFTGAGMQFAYGLAPLMVVALTGSASLAGLSVGLIGLSRFLVAYPVGKISDTYGRKPAILLGLGLALVGALV